MSQRSNFAAYPPMNMPIYAPAQYGLAQPPSQYNPSPSYYSTSSYSAPQSSNHRPLSPAYSGSTVTQNASYASYQPVPSRAQLAQQQMYPQVQQLRQSPPHTRAHAVPTYLPLSASHAPPAMVPPSQPVPHYSPDIVYGQSVNGVQYPASPNRPFSCDMCALSFNRQHDLKRHRETHSGEKPFLCNGGCGKTFTRKDALKRHQVRYLLHISTCLRELITSPSLSSNAATTTMREPLPFGF